MESESGNKLEKIDQTLCSLYHYTDIGAVASIIKNKKLWLSNAAFQNDSQEMLEGYDFLKKRLDQYELYPSLLAQRKYVHYLQGVLMYVGATKYQHSIFTCSFSRVADLLSQWRAYGNFAIEFSREVLAEQFSLYDCVYDNIKKVERLDQHLDDFFSAMDLNSGDPLGMVNALGPLIKGMGTFKSEYFQAEHEVRIVEAINNDVLHRPKKDYLVPYVELEFALESIRSIHIGPVANQDLTEASLLSLLRSHGLEHIPIIKSAVPYRS